MFYIAYIPPGKIFESIVFGFVVMEIPELMLKLIRQLWLGFEHPPELGKIDTKLTFKEHPHIHKLFFARHVNTFLLLAFPLTQVVFKNQFATFNSDEYTNTTGNTVSDESTSSDPTVEVAKAATEALMSLF